MPITLIGRYLFLGALRRPEDEIAVVRDELVRTGWYNADPVARIAFELAVRDIYGPRRWALDIPSLVKRIREFFGNDGVERFGLKNGEFLVRSVFDPGFSFHDLSFEQISRQEAFTIHGLVFFGIAYDLHYTDKEAHAIIEQAENRALAEGFHPTLG